MGNHEYNKMLKNSRIKIHYQLARRGFTLLEMLVVIVIIAGLAALVVPMFGGVSDKAAVTAALAEMKTIKEAIRDRFYADLGLIPEDPANPEYATRFLCLNKDCSDADIQAATACSDLGGNCEEMCDFLEAQLGGFLEAQRFLKWDQYSRKGWNGPYLEREAVAVYDDNGTPNDETDDKGYPMIIDPWEEISVHEIFSVRVMGGYRFIYDDIDGSGQMDGDDERMSARIVSFGADGVNDGGGTTPLPLPSKIGDDLVMFIFGGGPTRSPLGD